MYWGLAWCQDSRDIMETKTDKVSASVGSRLLVIMVELEITQRNAKLPLWSLLWVELHGSLRVSREEFSLVWEVRESFRKVVTLGQKSKEATSRKHSVYAIVLFFLAFRGQFSSAGKESACSAGDPGSIPGSGRSPGEGNGYPLQYCCLENSMDRGAWRATVHGVTRSQTWLSDWTAATDLFQSSSNLLQSRQDCCSHCNTRSLEVKS